MASAGKKVINLNTTLTTANTQQTVVTDAKLACQGGKLFIQNPNDTVKMMIGLAADSNLSVAGRIGWYLPPGAGIVIDDPQNNAVTAVSDTDASPITVYGIPV